MRFQEFKWRFPVTSEATGTANWCVYWLEKIWVHICEVEDGGENKEKVELCNTFNLIQTDDIVKLMISVGFLILFYAFAVCKILRSELSPSDYIWLLSKNNQRSTVIKKLHCGKRRSVEQHSIKGQIQLAWYLIQIFWFDFNWFYSHKHLINHIKLTNWEKCFFGCANSVNLKLLNNSGGSRCCLYAVGDCTVRFRGKRNVLFVCNASQSDAHTWRKILISKNENHSALISAIITQ